MHMINMHHFWKRICRMSFNYWHAGEISPQFTLTSNKRKHCSPPIAWSFPSPLLARARATWLIRVLATLVGLSLTVLGWWQVDAVFRQFPVDEHYLPPQDRNAKPSDGCYSTHDEAFYRRLFGKNDARLGTNCIFNIYIYNYNTVL